MQFAPRENGLMSPPPNPRLRISHVHVELSNQSTQSSFMDPQGSGPFIAAAGLSPEIPPVKSRAGGRVDARVWA